MANEMLKFFNLVNAGDSAVVRILHSSTKTVEKVVTHPVLVEGKGKKIKCCGENCPLCARQAPAEEKVYIHLWDYTDNTEKVWCRTDKILPKIDEVTQPWGGASQCVVKITRDTKEFPTYTIAIMPPQNYPTVNPELIDTRVAYRCFTTRSVDELNQFIATGVLPPHQTKPFVPKAEWEQQRNNNSAKPNTAPFSVTPAQPTPYAPTGTPYTVAPTSATAPQSTYAPTYAPMTPQVKESLEQPFVPQYEPIKATFTTTTTVTDDDMPF